jgi:hypothetical protein
MKYCMNVITDEFFHFKVRYLSVKTRPYGTVFSIKKVRSELESESGYGMSSEFERFRVQFYGSVQHKSSG